MSYPNIIFGRYGQEKEASSVKNTGIELGQRMMLPDGRMFAYAKNDSTALAIGELCSQAAVASSAFVVSWTGSAAVGATTVIATLSATGAVTKDQFVDGYIYVFDDNGQGYVHKVKANNSAAVSSTCTFTLYPYDPVQVLIKAASSKIGVRQNEFDGVLARAAGTAVVGIPAGVPANTVAASYYFWLQRRGPVGVLVAGTVGLVGEPAVAATTVAGGFSRYVIAADTTTVGHWELGRWMVAPAASTDYGLLYLTLD